MRPQRARLGLGQGFRNAPQEIPVKARAGLEECSSRELRVEAGWGRARGMFPQSTPLTLEQKWRGSTGGRALPRPPSGSRMAGIRFPCGDQHPADRALGCPGEETGGWRHCYSIGLSKKHFTNALSHYLTVMSVHPRVVTDRSWRKRNGVYSLTFVLSWHKTRSSA